MSYTTNSGELSVDGDNMQYNNPSQTNITNRKVKDFTVQKVWSPENTAPDAASVTVKLHAKNASSDEEVNIIDITGQTAVLNAANGYTYTWEKLPFWFETLSGCVEVDYYAEESNVPEGFASQSGDGEYISGTNDYKQIITNRKLYNVRYTNAMRIRMGCRCFLRRDMRRSSKHIRRITDWVQKGITAWRMSP